MSAVVKRERDSSNSPEPEAKRLNVDANVKVKSENNGNDTPASPDRQSNTATKKMASDASVKPEEMDAVDLGNVTADGGDNNADTSAVSNDQDGDQVAGSAGSVGDSSETQATQISMRTLIVTSDASIIIGKSGKHINEIRDKSNARLNIVSWPWWHERFGDRKAHETDHNLSTALCPSSTARRAKSFKATRSAS